MLAAVINIALAIIVAILFSWAMVYFTKMYLKSIRARKWFRKLPPKLKTSFEREVDDFSLLTWLREIVK